MKWIIVRKEAPHYFVRFNPGAEPVWSDNPNESTRHDVDGLRPVSYTLLQELGYQPMGMAVEE